MDSKIAMLWKTVSIYEVCCDKQKQRILELETSNQALLNELASLRQNFNQVTMECETLKKERERLQNLEAASANDMMDSYTYEENHSQDMFLNRSLCELREKSPMRSREMLGKRPFSSSETPSAYMMDDWYGISKENMEGGSNLLETPKISKYLSAVETQPSTISPVDHMANTGMMEDQPTEFPRGYFAKKRNSSLDSVLCSECARLRQSDFGSGSNLKKLCPLHEKEVVNVSTPPYYWDDPSLSSVSYYSHSSQETI